MSTNEQKYVVVVVFTYEVEVWARSAAAAGEAGDWLAKTGAGGSVLDSQVTDIRGEDDYSNDD